MTLRRIKKEFKSMIKNPSDLYTAQPLEDENLFEWGGTLYGPEESPYESGVFHLSIKIPTVYPFKPPKVKFLTPIYHPNINKDGDISMHMLECEWAPSLTISKVLYAIHSLLSQPDADDPLVSEIASIFKTDRKKFNELARDWTKKHAIKKL